MKPYLDSIQMIKDLGIFKGDRTGTGTQSMFGQHERYDLRNNKLPVVTTKKIHLHSVIHELIWMSSGDTRVDYLIRKGVRIWNEWVKPETAVYEDLSEAELQAKIDKHIGGHWVLAFTTIETEDGIEVLDIQDYLEKLDAAAVSAFWGQYPQITDRESIKKVVRVNLLSWKEAEQPVNPLAFFGHECLIRLHRLFFKSEPQRLIGGDLGAVYGKTWRNIEDIRIIPKLEWADFEKRGFQFVVDIPGTDASSDRCVVQRRIDQLQDVMDQLANGPDSRRIIVCAWDPRLVEDQALPPCHCFFQFWTRELSLEDRINALQDRHDAEDLLIPSRGQPPVRTVEAFKSRLCVWNNPAIVTEEFMHNRLDQAQAPRRGLSCHLYQRSVDTFLGKPFNITFYSLMTHQLANQFNMAAEEFIWTGGDCHIYNNHQEQTDLQLTREPYDTPRILFQPTSYGKDQREITPDDFVILGYESHPHIAGKVAV